MNILDLLVGKPIKTSDERAEQIGPARGIPIFGLDGLSSAAYGPEAALSLLIPLGLLGVQYIVPVSAAIIALLVIVYFSYRQTIAAYPGGGGSYTVARYNLGATPSLLAAAALLTDYILTAAVGISAGVGALISAVPSLLPHTVVICLGILLIITIVNLRGVAEAGVVFMVPTYLFVGTLLITIFGGLVRAALSGGHPTPVAALPAAPPVTAVVSFWLLLKVFSSGCTALTGVEAVSNGVKAFREPAVKNAQRTLTIIIFLLALLLAGISYLVKIYGIAATDPGKPGYQSLLSMLIAAVFGKGIFYYLTIASILLVLSLSANTAFADFPRLCKAIATNNYLPHAFGYRGRRLVYTYGIVVLGVLTAALLVIFGGVTDNLIPLYAVGAFLAFTLSQFGMVMHWRKNRGPGWVKSAMVNGLGAFRYGAYGCCGSCGEIRAGRLDHAALHSAFDFFLPHRSPPLSCCCDRHYRVRPCGTRESWASADHGGARRPLELDLQTGNRVCVAALAGNHRRSRRTGRAFRIAARGLGALCRAALPPSWRRAAAVRRSTLALPVHHRSAGSIHSGALGKTSRPADCGGHSGAGRGPLV